MPRYRTTIIRSLDVMQAHPQAWAEAHYPVEFYVPHEDMCDDAVEAIVDELRASISERGLWSRTDIEKRCTVPAVVYQKPSETDG